MTSDFTHTVAVISVGWFCFVYSFTLFVCLFASLFFLCLLVYLFFRWIGFPLLHFASGLAGLFLFLFLWKLNIQEPKGVLILKYLNTWRGLIALFPLWNMHEKFLYSDLLREMHFSGNTAQKRVNKKNKVTNQAFWLVNDQRKLQRANQMRSLGDAIEDEVRAFSNGSFFKM